MVADGRKIPVLFVHSATEPPLGADTWIHALMMRHLDRSRFDVHVACTSGKPGARTPTFQAVSSIPYLHVYPVNLGPEMFRRSRLGKARAALQTLPAISSLAGLARYIRKNKIRILHTSDRPRDALACALLARATGARCLIQVHVKYGEWMSPMLRWAMARADALAGVSAFVAKSLVDGGYSERKTHVVLNAIDVSAWCPDLDGRAVRSELGIPLGAPVIVCVARVYVAKGQSDLIRALAIVRREVGDARLVIVGQDYPKDNHHTEELRLLARELGVEAGVHFTGQRSDVAALMAASDICAMPSWEEPFGLVYAEAMAMKRPVVALSDGGTPEVVEHGKSGFLLDRGDVNRLADHLLTLIRDPGLRLRMGEYGRRKVESHFSPERMARDVGELYEMLSAP